MAEAGQDHLYKKVELAGTAVDEFSKCQGVIASPHLHIHNGKVFHWAQKVTSIGAGASTDVLIQVPALTFPHMHRFRVNTGDGDIDIDMYEDTVISATGAAALNVHNLNRNSANTPAVDLFTGPTVSALGTLLHTIWLPPSGTQGAHVEGISNAEAGEEWILKPDTNHIIRLTNNTASAISAWFELFWYEL